MNRLYFDVNASAPLSKGLPAKMAEWLAMDFKNPSSAHRDGQEARVLVERARRQILECLGAKGQRLVFTSGGTEANNMVLRSAFKRRGSKNKLLLTNVEHACVNNVALDLESQGAELVWLNVNAKGQFDWDDFKSKLSDDVFMVSVMAVQNETGFIFPILEMAALAKERGILFHTDAVCAVGKYDINFKEWNVDFLTFSSHKFGGLKGVGGVIYSEASYLDALILGGSHEAGKRAGTENVYGVLSTAYALEQSLEHLEQNFKEEQDLRQTLIAGLKKIYPNLVMTESEQNMPQTLCASFVGLNGNVLLTNLDLENVSASYGSACASGSLEISRALLSMKLTVDQARSAIRFSFGGDTTADDVKSLLERVQKAVQRMV